MHRQVHREDVAGAGGEVLVEQVNDLQVVHQLIRFLADGDPGAGGAVVVGVDAHLGVKQEVVSGGLTVGVIMVIVEFFDDVHDFDTQPVGFLAVAEAFVTALFFQKRVDALRKAHEAEHGRELIPPDKALLCQEAGGKPAAFLHQETDTLIHVPGHHIHDPGQNVLFKVFNILCPLCDVGKDQPGQGVGAAALIEAIVAAGDAVIVPQLPAEHFIIGKAGLGGLEGAPDTGENEFVGGVLGDPHGQVGHGVFQLPLHLQQEVAQAGGLGANVGMAEGVQNGAVNGRHPQPQGLFHLVVGKVLNVGVQQHIQIADEDGIIGDAGDVVEHDHEVGEGFGKIPGRAQLQKGAALPQEFGEVDADVPGTVGSVPLKEVTDAPGINIAAHQLVQALRLIQNRQKILRLAGKVGNLLLMGGSSVCQGVINLRTHGFHHFRGQYAFHKRTSFARV